MRKVMLFIAMSLDGYIADNNGKVDWLGGQGDGDGGFDPYEEFIKGVDTVIMGYNTYNQIVTELSPGEWVYSGLKCYVLTHRSLSSTEEIAFTELDPAELIKELRVQSGKDIWICGGAQTIRQLVREDLIDCYYITVIPTLLGSGLRLFENGGKVIKLRLIKSQSYNGMTDLIYTRR